MMKFTLHIWRQASAEVKGKIVSYKITDVSPSCSFLEMLDMLNNQLVEKGDQPVAFDHDCREGICGSCSLMINGRAHGKDKAITTCQLHMRSFSDGDEIYIEPWRARSFPVIRDLATDRSSFDRIMANGGFVSVNSGGSPDGNALPVAKVAADLAMDAAQCIGCGACVASCKNASAMLFVAAKASHLALLPQGAPERNRRVKSMVEAMDEEGFGSCTNQFECEAACPKEISVKFIGKMNREYLKSSLTSEES